MISFSYDSGARHNQAELLRETINAALKHSDDRLYLLIDPVSLPENIQHPFVDALVEQRPVPVRLPHDRLSAEAYPWLVALDINNPQHATLLDNSITHALEELHPERLSEGHGRAVCGWLISPYDADTLARQLGETTIQRLPGDAQILLRYYDPAVHSVLWLHFSRLQQHRLMGIIRTWLYADGDGQVVDRQHTPPAHPHHTFSLALSENDAATVSLTGKINRTLEHYRFHRPGAPRETETQAIRIVRAALERAISLHGFEQEADQQALALDCLYWHPQFDMHPDMRVLLSAQERDAQSCYTRCTASLTDRLRQQMCDELNATTVTPPAY